MIKSLSMALISAVAVASSSLELFKVRLLEHNSNGAGTWLYRTNLPIINGTFATDTLLSFMR